MKSKFNKHEILSQYSKRKDGSLYGILRPEVMLSVIEKQFSILNILRNLYSSENLGELKLVEVGCGNGGNLLEFVRYGFNPKNIIGIEVLPDRVAKARERLPSNISIFEAEITEAKIQNSSIDIAYQSLVFSSVLDPIHRKKMAEVIWSWVREGGGILWYDFSFNNPNNRDVTGIKMAEIRKLFPLGKIIYREKITLAPPISRVIGKYYPFLLPIFNKINAIKTHNLLYIQK